MKLFGLLELIGAGILLLSLPLGNSTTMDEKMDKVMAGLKELGVQKAAAEASQDNSEMSKRWKKLNLKGAAGKLGGKHLWLLSAFYDRGL